MGEIMNSWALITVLRRSVPICLLGAFSSVLVADPQTGFLEICSTAEGRVGRNLLTVSISGVPRQFTLPVTACTAAIELPAGEVSVTEQPVEGIEVADMDAYGLDTRGERESRLIVKIPSARTVRATVLPGDVSVQTIVMFIVKPPQ